MRLKKTELQPETSFDSSPPTPTPLPLHPYPMAVLRETKLELKGNIKTCF